MGGVTFLMTILDPLVNKQWRRVALIFVLYCAFDCCKVCNAMGMFSKIINVVIIILSLTLGFFFMFVGILKLTPAVKEDLHEEMVSVMSSSVVRTLGRFAVYKHGTLALIPRMLECDDHNSTDATDGILQYNTIHFISGNYLYTCVGVGAGIPECGIT